MSKILFSFVIFSALHICISNACSPCEASIKGRINLNVDNGFSVLGDKYCIGRSNNISGTFQILLKINTSNSDTDYTKNLEYNIVLYDDQQNSHPSLNDTMTCQQKISHSRAKVVEAHVVFHQNEYYIPIIIEENAVRNWWIYLVYCNTDNNDIIYPLIDYAVNLTLSQYILDHERTCNSKDNIISTGLMVSIFIIVIVVVIIGGVFIWLCDVRKRRKFKNQAMSKGLVINDDELNELDENNSDDEKAQLAKNSILKEDVQLETA